jgi:hypothetical protein
MDIIYEEYNVRRGEKPSYLRNLRAAFMTTFFPLGYPHSVKKEYIQFQKWDSLQALSSYVRGVLSSRFVFDGLGVGDANKTAMGAALSWVLKDGVGIICSLLFAYKFSPTFDAYPQSWRLVADTLCNVGLLLNMSVGLFPNHFVAITTMASICFGCVGIAAGASKSKISAHLARESSNLGDLIAKESTQESAVTLVGMVLGVVVTSMIGNDIMLSWAVFMVCTVFHQYANYRLAKVLKFETLNNTRLWLLAQSASSASSSSTSTSTASLLGLSLPVSWSAPAPGELLESVFTLPLWLSYRGPVMGASLGDAACLSHRDPHYLSMFNGKGYVVDCSKHDHTRAIVCLRNDHQASSAVEGYLVACMLQQSSLLQKKGDNDSVHESVSTMTMIPRMQAILKWAPEVLRRACDAGSSGSSSSSGGGGYDATGATLCGDQGFRHKLRQQPTVSKSESRKKSRSRSRSRGGNKKKKE